MTRPGRPALLRAGLIIVGGVALFVVLVGFGGAQVEAPTVGLAFAGMMLLYALRRLFMVAAALGRSGDVSDLGLGRVSKRELRDEKRRLLRAIKELEFDFGMGKLSKQDYESVSSAYKMRAIEVMRALEGNADLHPEVAALLRGEGTKAEAPEDSGLGDEPRSSGGGDASPSPDAAPAEATPKVGAGCPSCDATNDDDARFCKHCGTALEHA